MTDVRDIFGVASVHRLRICECIFALIYYKVVRTEQGPSCSVSCCVHVSLQGVDLISTKFHSQNIKIYA